MSQYIDYYENNYIDCVALDSAIFEDALLISLPVTLFVCSALVMKFFALG